MSAIVLSSISFVLTSVIVILSVIIPIVISTTLKNFLTTCLLFFHLSSACPLSFCKMISHLCLLSTLSCCRYYGGDSSGSGDSRKSAGLVLDLSRSGNCKETHHAWRSTSASPSSASL